MKVNLNKLIWLSVNPFSYLEDKSMSNNRELINMSKSIYSVITKFSLAILIIGIVYAASIYATTKNSKKHSESKEKLIFKFIMIIILFAIPYILTIIYGAATSFS